MITSFWDMDHTVINNDCDVSWKEFLVQKGLAEPDQLTLVAEYYRQYEAGALQVDDYLAFQLQEFGGRRIDDIQQLCQEHFETVAKKTIYPAAFSMVKEQQKKGWQTVLLTATNRAIALPLATHFGFSDVIASELEIESGSYTGRPAGVYCCGEGKLERLAMYCGANNLELSDVHYYGDSLSDLFVLRSVGFPHAVNPMPKLRTEAELNGWDIIEFKGE